MPAKRPSDAGVDGTPNKRTESPGDFSGSVRKKLTGTTRTGQACDRCKVRKIRCDARAGGCSPCVQNNLECKTTDRITGRATSRGHTEHIESENIVLKQYVNDLRAQLQENGVEPRASPIAPMGYMGGDSQSGFGWGSQVFDLTQILSADVNSKSRNRASVLPEYRNAAIGDNYMGVSGANEWLSPIKGTTLALFGMELDLADFITNEAEEAFSPTSYENFLAFSFSGQTVEKPSLPVYHECKAFCEWYFKAVNCHAPILHKPAMLAMVDSLHMDQTYQATTAETVQLHMLLAMMLFQFSTRNATPTNWAHHYRYSVSFLPKLIAERTLPNMQAIALICLHLRNFTKPGAAWFMSSVALTLCVEMGLHRSVNAWNKSVPEMSLLEVEMRKRVFWSVLLVHTSISNKLGRPLAVRMEDFDVEFPRAMDDYTTTEGEIDDWHKCSFRVATHNFKWVMLDIQVQTSIYSVRTPPASYELTLQRLESYLETFQKSIPIELLGGVETAQDDRVCSLYLQFGCQELNLLIHHPAVCRTQNQDIMNKNLDVCLDAGAKLLHIAQSMRALKSLDTTWLNTTVWLSAMFVTLFTWSQRKDQITLSELATLKDTMEAWLSIIAEIGQMLGSGPKLHNAVRQIVDAAMNNISRHIATKTASAAVASASITSSPPPTAEAHTQPYTNAPAGYAPAYATDGVPTSAADATATAYALTNGAEEAALSASAGGGPAPYPTPNQFAYPDPSGGNAGSMASYSSGSLAFDNAYNASPDSVEVKPDLSAQLSAHNANTTTLPTHHHQHGPTGRSLSQSSGMGAATVEQQAQQFLSAYNSPPPNNDYMQQQQQQQQQQQVSDALMGSPAAWRHFTQHMLGQFQPLGGLGGAGNAFDTSSLLNLNSHHHHHSSNTTPQQQHHQPNGKSSMSSDSSTASLGHGAGLPNGSNVMALQGASSVIDANGNVSSSSMPQHMANLGNGITMSAGMGSAGMASALGVGVGGGGDGDGGQSANGVNGANGNGNGNGNGMMNAPAVNVLGESMWPFTTYGPVSSAVMALGGYSQA